MHCSRLASAAACALFACTQSDRSIIASRSTQNIVQDDYLGNESDSALLDGISLEWEYFMVHDDDFTGIIGYVLADPREFLGGDADLKLMPSGMNLAVAGRWGGVGTDNTVSDFINFKPSQMTPGVHSMTVVASDDDDGDDETGNWCRLSVVPNPDGSHLQGKLRLEGKTPGARFDVTVEQGWTERDGVGRDAAGNGPFGPARSDRNDIGVLPGEHWTVNMIWPRTDVKGSMTDLRGTNPVVIDGHGYRENSWGRWTFVTDGWDFAILSDDTAGVQWSWQTYHNSASMDFLDVSFIDNNELKVVQFEGKHGELGWSHSDFAWNADAYQCAPQDALVEGANDEYYVKATITIGDQQTPLLSDLTVVTKVYAIMEWFPTIEGEIFRADGTPVTTFQGQAGGEISFIKSPWKVSDWWCDNVFGKQFRQTLEHKRPGDCARQNRSYKCRNLNGCKWVSSGGWSGACHDE